MVVKIDWLAVARARADRVIAERPPAPTKQVFLSAAHARAANVRKQHGDCGRELLRLIEMQRSYPDEVGLEVEIFLLRAKYRRLGAELAQ